MGLGKAIIKKTNTFDPVRWEKNGKSGTRYPASILIGEQWYNTSFFSEEEITEFKKVQQGQEMLVVLFKKKNEKNPDKPFYNFRFPKKDEENSYRLDELEKRIEALEK